MEHYLQQGRIYEIIAGRYSWRVSEKINCCGMNSWKKNLIEFWEEPPKLIREFHEKIMRNCWISGKNSSNNSGWNPSKIEANCGSNNRTNPWRNHRINSWTKSGIIPEKRGKNLGKIPGEFKDKNSLRIPGEYNWRFSIGTLFSIVMNSEKNLLKSSGRNLWKNSWLKSEINLRRVFSGKILGIS